MTPLSLESALVAKRATDPAFTADVATNATFIVYRCAVAS
jgi:hypothetical protein